MEKREYDLIFKVENMLRRFHNGEFVGVRGANRIFEEWKAMGMSHAAQYEILREHCLAIAETNNSLEEFQMRRFDDLIVHAERIFEEEGFELPQEGSRLSDFKLVPIGTPASEEDFSDVIF